MYISDEERTKAIAAGGFTVGQRVRYDGPTMPLMAGSVRVYQGASGRIVAVPDGSTLDYHGRPMALVKLDDYPVPVYLLAADLGTTGAGLGRPPRKGRRWPSDF